MIKAPDLPFDPDDRIFFYCTKYCEDGCECSKDPHSYNDWLQKIKDISGVNEELLGSVEDQPNE